MSLPRSLSEWKALNGIIVQKGIWCSLNGVHVACFACRGNRRSRKGASRCWSRKHLFVKLIFSPYAFVVRSLVICLLSFYSAARALSRDVACSGIVSLCSSPSSVRAPFTGFLCTLSRRLHVREKEMYGDPETRLYGVDKLDAIAQLTEHGQARYGSKFRACLCGESHTL